MKKLSYGSVLGTFVQVDFMSQVEQLANLLAGSRSEALMLQSMPGTKRLFPGVAECQVEFWAANWEE